jgi:hypothetical protein
VSDGLAGRGGGFATVRRAGHITAGSRAAVAAAGVEFVASWCRAAKSHLTI